MKKLSISRLSMAFAITAMTTGAAMAQTASIQNVEPLPGSALSTSNCPNFVTVFFSEADINIESANITYTPAGQTSTVTEELSVSWDEYRPGQPWDIGTFNEQLFFYVATQKAALGSTFTVTLNNVTYNGTPVTTSELDNDAITFENGNIILEYSVPAMKFELVSEEWPEVFYNVFPADAVSVAVLTFNENVRSVGNVSYRNDNAEFGVEGGSENVEYGDFPSSIVTINDNTVLLDFAKYNVDFIVPGKVISVYVTGIVSESGQELSSVPTGHMSYVENTGSTGVEGIEAVNGMAEYFNLQGVKVANPEKGQMLIKVQNGKASKIVVR